MQIKWELASCHALEGGDTVDIFFPGLGRPRKEPKWKKYCDVCQIQYDCLRYGIAHSEIGIWGGTTDNERLLLPLEVQQTFVAEAKAEGWYDPPLAAADVFPQLHRLDAGLTVYEDFSEHEDQLQLELEPDTSVIPNALLPFYLDPNESQLALSP